MTRRTERYDDLIQLLGKRTDPNPFLVPNGSMSRAVNMWMVRQGLHSKRRGYSRWSNTLTFPVSKIFPYGNELVAFVGQASGGGTWRVSRVSAAGVISNYAGSTNFFPPDQQFAWKHRACVAGQDFFFNTNDSCYRISGVGKAPQKAGGLIAPSFDNMAIGTVLTGTGGFLADQFTCAYRYLLGTTNTFGRDIIGPVSGRLTVPNQDGTSGWSAGVAANVTVRCLLPPEATTGTFIRLFRSAVIAVGSTPDDDLQMVFEALLTAANVAAGFVDITDIVPDGLRGPFIYTAPNAGEGILQNNLPPPQCADLVLHKNRVWYMNTRQPASFDLQILSVGGSDGIQDGDELELVGTSTVTLTAKTSPGSPGDYLLQTGGTVAYNIEQTALNLVTVINRLASNTQFWAQYISGPNDIPGKIQVYSRSRQLLSFAVIAAAGAARNCWNPALLAGNHTVNLARVSNVVTATVLAGTASFEVGESFVMFGTTGSFGSGPFTVTGVTSTTFTYAEAGVNATNSSVVAQLVATSPMIPSALSVQEALPNRVYYSKPGEFDAVPIVNFFDLGAADKDIIAGVSAMDMMWFWKRDGIIRLVGDDETNFQPIDVDRTVVCNARETVVKFLGAPCGMTDRGFVQAGVSGLTYLSQPVQKEFLDQMVGTAGTNLEPLAFAVPYDSEGLCLLLFAGGRDKVTGTVLACQGGYVYSAKANDWTDWLFGTANGVGKMCGTALNGQLYFGDRWDTSFSETYIYQERKSRTAADYKDTYGDASDNAITSILAPTLLTNRAPGFSKLFKECCLLFEGTQPASITIDDRNEWAAGGRHTMVSSSGFAGRFWPFDNAARGRILQLTITHATISEGFDLAGIQVTYELEGLEAER